MTDRGSVVTARSDILVDDPISREALREVDQAYLVRCDSHRCQWEGLFPSIELAERAANTHLLRQRREQDACHVGSRGASLIELDGDRARQQQDSHHVYIGEVGPEEPLTFDDGFGPWYPRSTEKVDDLVERGDRIELPGGRSQREGKVASVTGTRSGGILTWSVSYADPGTDLTRNDWQPKFQNELVARDGNIYRRYGEQFLGGPAFEVVGETDHQADFTEFDGGASA